MSLISFALFSIFGELLFILLCVLVGVGELKRSCIQLIALVESLVITAVFSPIVCIFLSASIIARTSGDVEDVLSGHTVESFSVEFSPNMNADVAIPLDHAWCHPYQ